MVLRCCYSGVISVISVVIDMRMGNLHALLLLLLLIIIIMIIMIMIIIIIDSSIMDY